MAPPLHFAALAERTDESLGLAWFDDAHSLLAVDEYCSAQTNHVAVTPREIIKRGIALEAANVIIAHNHPSGCPQPSEADFRFTRRLASVLDALEINVYDHLILSRGGRFSFRDAGLL